MFHHDGGTSVLLNAFYLVTQSLDHWLRVGGSRRIAFVRRAPTPFDELALGRGNYTASGENPAYTFLSGILVL